MGSKVGEVAQELKDRTYSTRSDEVGVPPQTRQKPAAACGTWYQGQEAGNAAGLVLGCMSETDL